MLWRLQVDPDNILYPFRWLIIIVLIQRPNISKCRCITFLTQWQWTVLTSEISRRVICLKTEDVWRNILAPSSRCDTHFRNDSRLLAEYTAMYRRKVLLITTALETKYPANSSYSFWPYISARLRRSPRHSLTVLATKRCQK